jgi:hypothetical protein
MWSLFLDTFDKIDQWFQSNNFQNYVDTNYSGFSYYADDLYGVVRVDFFFKFKPFYKIELKKYSQFLNEVNKNVTNVEIPKNAILYDNKYIWRDLLIYGDPDNYDNPFINNNHYIFNDIVFYLKPELSDKNTTVLMNEFLLSFRDRGYTFNKDNIKVYVKKKEAC